MHQMACHFPLLHFLGQTPAEREQEARRPPEVALFLRQPRLCAKNLRFAEAVAELALPFARKTVQLRDMLRQPGFALGAERGARIAAVLKMACSAEDRPCCQQVAGGQGIHANSSKMNA